MPVRKEKHVAMNIKDKKISDLCGGTLELQQHYRTGAFQDVEIEQKTLLPVVQEQ